MSVVEMKRVVVLAPADKAVPVLEALQAQGAVHLVPLAATAEVPAEPGARATAARRLEVSLTAHKGKGVAPSGELVQGLVGLSDVVLLERAEALLSKRAEADAKVQALAKEHEAAAPFGTSCQKDFARLAEAGVTLRVYALGKKSHRDLELPSGVPAVELPWTGRNLLVTAELGAGLDHHLERLEPPVRPAPEIAVELETARARLAQLEEDMAAMTTALPAISRERARLTDLHRLAEARSKAGGDGVIFAVTGWCPAARSSDVAKAVMAEGGAVSVSDPLPEEEPPVEVVNPAMAGWFEPLLHAFQLPKYREPDPTVLFAPFMAIFFGFCLGDAAYGLILFIAATVLRRKFKLVEGTMHKSMRLMQLLGLSTVVVGLLTGVVFGKAIYEIEALANLGLTSDKFLFFLSKNPQNFFYAALVFGAVQLGFGLLVRLVLQLKHKNFQEALGTVGWFGLLPAVPIWVALGNNLPFLGALVLIVLFRSTSKNPLVRLGTGLWAIYEWVLGLFGDVMSYLRIFGLGLSSGIIAQVVNTIAMMLFEGGSIGGYIGGILILLIGHTFNFAMAVLGSTVHSARLQFLEFFGKFFEGGGQPFSPFARTK